MTATGTPVDAGYVCPHFDRSPMSLIEEPEICENCAVYSDGLCTREED